MAKQQSIERQARATPAAKFISQANDDTTILLAFESSVGNIFNRRIFSNAEVPKWLAISEGKDGMKSIEDLIDILTELSPLPDYQSPSRNAINVCHPNLLALYKDRM